MDDQSPAESTTVDDETLIGLIRSRDEGALSSLYERYSRLLFAIALHITGDTWSAEEVTQDVFQAVWTRAAQFRPTAGSVQAWLSGIVRHRALDEVRSRWHRARQTDVTLDALPDLHAAVERGVGPSRRPSHGFAGCTRNTAVQTTPGDRARLFWRPDIS